MIEFLSYTERKVSAGVTKNWTLAMLLIDFILFDREVKRFSNNQEFAAKEFEYSKIKLKIFTQ